MNLMKQINNYVGTLVLGTALTFGGMNYALAEVPKTKSKTEEKEQSKKIVSAQEDKIKVSGSVELMAGQETATLDTKLLLNFDDRFSLMNRNRVTSDYEGNIVTFHMVKIGYRLIDGLAVTAGLMGNPKTGIPPRVGLEYFKKLNDFKLYQQVLVSTETDPIISSLTNFSYTPKLTGDWSLFFGIENVSFFSKEGHDISFQRPRVGIGYKELQVGVAVDLTEKNTIKDEEKCIAGEIGKCDTKIFNYNVGGFTKVNF